MLTDAERENEQQTIVIIHQSSAFQRSKGLHWSLKNLCWSTTNSYLSLSFSSLSCLFFISGPSEACLPGAAVPGGGADTDGVYHV